MVALKNKKKKKRGGGCWQQTNAFMHVDLLKFKQSIGMGRKVIYMTFSVADRWSEYFKTSFSQNHL